MLKVGTLLKHLSQSHARLTAAQTAFANYLMHFHRAEDFASPDLVQNFFNDCLEYPHWQQNAKALGNEIKETVKRISEIHEEDFDPENYKWPEDIQVVEIQRPQDFSDAVNSYLVFKLKKAEKFRLFYDDLNKKMIAIIRSFEGHITAQVFMNKFIINQGQLEPLQKDLKLYYDQSLELAPELPQKLEIQSYLTTRFVVDDGKAFGTAVKGHLFQKAFELKGEELNGFGQLWLSIKRIEQFFLKRDSDPFYMKTIQNLERSIELIKAGDLETQQKASMVLGYAQSALESVFVGDRVLALLIKDLSYTLASSSRPIQKESSQTWSPSPLPKPRPYDLTN